MLYISNALYLASVTSAATQNRPLIGWQSVARLSDFSSPDGLNAGVVWSPDTYTYWRSENKSGAGELTFSLRINNPGLKTVDYIGVAGHNFYKNSTDLPFTFQLFYSFDGSTWLEAFTEISPANNNAIMIHFDAVTAPYFDMVITSQPATDAYVIISHIKLGEILRLYRKVYVGMSPFTLNKKVDKTVTISESGKYLGAHVKAVVNLYSLAQVDNPPDFVRAKINDFLDHVDLLTPDFNNGPAGTFFAAWRPDEYPDEILYCHPGSIQRPVNQRPNGVMQWQISGEAEK